MIGNCQMTKKIENFINKLFKMADGYLAEYSKLPVTANSEKLSRNMINLTFESFRKKKDTTPTSVIEELNYPEVNVND